MNNNIRNLLVFICAWGASFFIFPDSIFLEHCSFALQILIFYKFLKELSNQLSIKNIIAFIAVFQWLFGAILGYKFSSFIAAEYRMAVSKEIYFGYVFPATVAMLIGLYSFSSNINVLERLNKIDFDKAYRKGVILIIIGVVANSLTFLGFLGFLLNGLKYIGLFYVFFSGHRYRYLWVIGVMGSLFLDSLGMGMFHDLLLWGTFFLSIFFITNKSSLMFRTLVICFGIICAMAIQISKSEIRSKNWNQNEYSAIKLFTYGLQTITDKFSNTDEFFSDENIGNQVTRLNQGWIIANVMDFIPSEAPYANGESVKESIIAAIFPRFIMDTKAKAGGWDNIHRYSSVQINEGTSMDISQVGEAYANFGVYGGIIMMFLLGLFFGWIINFVEKKSINNPELLLWLPLLFLQVVKAETSLVTILNHLVKASIVVWIFFTPFIYKYFNMGEHNANSPKNKRLE